MTTPLETLAQRNVDFAAQRFAGGLRMMPRLKTILIGCVDPRVDPEHILGAEPGDLAVLRNVGGRVTPDVRRQLLMLREVTQAMGADLGPGWNLLVLHHTDCGITRIEQSPEMAPFLGAGAEQLTPFALQDPRAAVAYDVAALRADPLLPRGCFTAGWVYDVATGKVEVVVPAA